MTTFSFETVAQAVAVLGKYGTKERLLALEGIGVDLSKYTHRELAEIVCASREKVTIAMTLLGKKSRGHQRKQAQG